MRGRFTDQGGLFSYIAPDKRVPANHPLRKVRELVRDVLSDLNRSLGRLYASEGRPSIPPEQLLSALLLQVFYGIRSERQLMEQLDYNLLYRWFVGLSPDDPVWDPTTFTKNRERLQNGEVFTKFMTRLLNHPQVKPLLSDEHFSVDGTLIEAWASQKSFRPKDGSGDDDDGANFHGQKRKNDTHASTSDPDSRLYRKAAGREAKLCYMGHATMENRHGLAVAGRVTHANVKEVFGRHRSQPIERVIALINPVLRGWVNYFAVGHSSECFSFIKDWVEKKIRRHLMRARKRKGFGWTRWSRQWLYETLKLFNSYEVRWPQPKVAPAG